MSGAETTMERRNGHELLVIGIGNPERCDDGVGLVIARNLAAKNLPNLTVVEVKDDPAALTDTWKGATEVIVVDAVCSGARPGTVHRLDGHKDSLPTRIFRSSSHAFGVGEAIEMARAMHELPPRVTIYGIEGKAFDVGIGLSREVVAAARRVVAGIAQEARSGQARRPRMKRQGPGTES